MAIAPADPVRRLTLGDLESIIERALDEARARGSHAGRGRREPG